MIKILLVLLILLSTLTGCLPDITYMDSSLASANVSSYNGTPTYIPYWRTATILGNSLILNSVTHISVEGDIETDRWITSDTNTFLGIHVIGGNGLSHTALEEGWYNTIIGNNAAHDITKGSRNVIIGSNAGYSLTTSRYNVIVGDDSARFVTTADYNTTLGYQALANGTGGKNTAIGNGALATPGAGEYNTGVGVQVLNTANGSYNTALGVWAGETNTGSRNLFLGYRAGQNSGAENDKLYIDNTNTATPLIAGDFSTNTLTVNNNLVVNGTINYGADAGASDTYACTIAGITAYTTGLVIYFKANTANTGACTIDVNGLGAKSLKYSHDRDPEDSYIESGSIMHCIYDGTNFQILNPDANP